MSMLNEPVLDDSYPVHAGYLYVANGEPIVSDISGSVARLKAYTGAVEIRRCDIFGREALWGAALRPAKEERR